MIEQQLDPLHLQIYSLGTLKVNKTASVKFVNDNSFIARICSKQGNHFRHINFDGTVLCQLQLPIYRLEDYLVADQNKLIILSRSINNEKQCNLTIWNFHYNATTQLPLHIHNTDEPYFNIGFFYFSQSQTICFWNKIQQSQHVLAYYKISELGQAGFVHEFVYNDKFIKIVKVNQISMIGFLGVDKKYEQKSWNNILINLYDLDLQSLIGQLKQIVLDTKLKSQKYGKFLQSRISDIWQCTANQLYVQIQTYDKNCKDMQMQKADEDYLLRYRTFYYSLEDHTSREGRINFPFPHRLQFINTIRQLSYTQKQKWSLQKKLNYTLKFFMAPKQNKSIGVPIYYIDPHQEQVLRMNQPITEPWEVQFEWLNYQSDKMFKIQRKPNCQEIMKVIVYAFPEQWYGCSIGLNFLAVHWMAELVEQCCDDLLNIVYHLL